MTDFSFLSYDYLLRRMRIRENDHAAHDYYARLSFANDVFACSHLRLLPYHVALYCRYAGLLEKEGRAIFRRTCLDIIVLDVKYLVVM